MSETTALGERLRDVAAEEGFTLFGVAPAVAANGFVDLVRWIDAGYAGEMDYFRSRQDAYRHPSSVLEGVRSIVALAYPYDAAACGSVEPCGSIDRGEGRIARYVFSGVDYHDTIHPKLKRLCKVLLEHHDGAHARGVVDTSPLLERELAELAGLGWRGKNTLLLNKHAGSYFFLACVLTDVVLPVDAPHHASHCGTCTACLDACPTDAFPQAGVLDATRCISYLTIEHRGPIPVELREGIGDWLFGCDICQEVCPWNRRPARIAQPTERPLDRLSLVELFGMSDEEFRHRFRKTPLWRTRRRGILRNAAIVLGNQRDETAIDALELGLHDQEPIVRGAAAWALGKIGGQAATVALKRRLEVETDDQVRQELKDAQ